MQIQGCLIILFSCVLLFHSTYAQDLAKFNDYTQQAQQAYAKNDY